MATIGNNTAVVAVPNSPGALTPFMREQLRDFSLSLRVRRDVLADRWFDRVDDLRQEYAEDRRQVQAHVRRAKHCICEHISSKLKRSGPGSGPDAVPAQTFPQFSRLPTEIRLQIWKEALGGPRAVMLRSPYRTSAHCASSASRMDRLRIRLGFRPKGENGSGPPRRHLGWSSTTPPPALLHATSESRSVALKRYRPVLGTGDDDAREGGPGQDGLGDRGIPQPPPIYADLETDFICLSGAEVDPRCNALWREAAGDVVRIRHLAIAAFWGPCSGYHHHHHHQHGSRRRRRVAAAAAAAAAAADDDHDDDDDDDDVDDDDSDSNDSDSSSSPTPASGGGADEDGDDGAVAFSSPPPPLGPAFASLEDVLMVRSLRWQMGRLPKAAMLDFEGWAARETAAEGVSHWRTTWREDGALVVRDGAAVASAAAAAAAGGVAGADTSSAAVGAEGKQDVQVTEVEVAVDG